MGDRDERVKSIEAIAAAVRGCTQCRLHKGRIRAVPGEGQPGADVFLIGEAPGREEDASGRPFVGSAGKILDRALAAARLPRKTVYVTNAVKCRPPANRAPRADEMEACRAYLMRQIAAIQPKVLVTLGSTALRSLLGPRAQLRDARGKRLAFGRIPVLATYHPAAILYNRRIEGALRTDLKKAAKLAHETPQAVRSAPPRKGRPTRTARSSGAAVVGEGGRILLLRKADEGSWCLPKGTVEPGETAERTAVREVREETGLRVKLLRPLKSVRYAFYWPPDRVNYEKTVMYFLARRIGGRVKPEPEFDEARWVSRSEAMRLLRWPNDKAVVAEAFASTN